MILKTKLIVLVFLILILPGTLALKAQTVNSKATDVYSKYLLQLATEFDIKSNDLGLDPLETSISEFINSYYDPSQKQHSTEDENKIQLLKEFLTDCINEGDIDNIKTFYIYLEPLIKENNNEFLNLTVDSNRIDILEFFISKNLNIKFDNWGETLLHKASEKWNIPIINLLIKNNLDINATNILGLTPVNYAIHTITARSSTDDKIKCFETVKTLLNYGATIKYLTKDEEPTGAFHWVCESGYIPLIELLLKNGANSPFVINQYYLNGTPLFYAFHNDTTNNNFDAEKLLIENGADIDLKKFGLNGMTCLSSVISYGSDSLFNYILNKVTDINLTDNEGRTPLHIAARVGKEFYLYKLIEKGANINAIEKNGYTPLHYAVLAGQLSAVRILLEKGADKNIKGGYDKETALDIAKWDKNKNKEIINLLKQ